MILGYFIKDLPLTSRLESQLYQDLKEKKTGKVALARLIKDARKRGVDGKIYRGKKVGIKLLYHLLQKKKLIILGGLSEGSEFEWVVSGFNREGDFYVTDPRLRQKDIYPSKLVELLAARPKGRWCLAIGKNLKNE
jgi:hypothetical protein